VDSDITLVNVLNDCRDGIYNRRTADSAENVTLQTLTYSPSLAINEAEAVLDSAPVIEAVNNGSGFVFDQTAFVGAVDPAAGSGWWEGWTLPNTVGGSEPVAPADFVSCTDNDTVCTLSGTIDEDYTLVAGVEWRLSGEVLVGTGNRTVDSAADVQAVRDAGVTLTVRPGVDVRAFDDGSLLVTRGSKLMAVGSPASPITFSSLDDNFDGEGEWGGVIIQGFAPQYGQGGTGPCYGSGTVCNVVGEGGTVVGNYGGNEAADNSGMLRYVRIAEGGLVAGPNNEINGLTLQGVGHGTTIEYVQVHGNLDDGIEWFGGTVNVRYAVLTNNDDDDIDYDEGFKGNVQYAIIRKNPNKAAPTGSNDPRAVEANSSDDEYVPETEAVLANILILGSDVNNNDESDAGAQPGMRLRGAVTTAVYNSAVRDFDVGCVRIDDADINGDGSTIVNSSITLVNVLGECADGFYNRRVADVEDNAGEESNTGVTVDGAYALTDSGALVPAPSITPVDNGSGFTFDETDYVGAVEPGTPAGSAWWSGWIIPGSL
jgi:hypothetical protein